MEGTNRILALFVGLFVVLLLVGVGLSRIAKDKKPLSGALGNIFASKITPTREPANPKTDSAIVIKEINSPNIPAQNPSAIPETGATTLPIIITTLFLGKYLTKHKKT